MGKARQDQGTRKQGQDGGIMDQDPGPGPGPPPTRNRNTNAHLQTFNKPLNPIFGSIDKTNAMYLGYSFPQGASARQLTATIKQFLVSNFCSHLSRMFIIDMFTTNN